MNLEMIIPTEVSKSDREGQMSYDISYMSNLKKNDVNELVYKTDKDSQTQKTNLWLPKGERGRDKLGFGINRYTLLYIK